MQAEEEDIQEIRKILETAERPYVKTLLGNSLKTAQTQLKQRKEKQEAEKKRQLEVKLESQKKITYTPITSYAWDQSTTFVSVYVTLPKQVESDDVEINFGNRELDAKIKIDEKTYRLLVSNLCHPIQTEGSTWRVKGSSLTIKLKKGEPKKDWSGLDDKEELKATRHKALAEKGASTMELLQNMYKEADEKTQQSLLEAYAKGADKREQNRTQKKQES
eukprot:TRINITY_DN1714_c0_g1_i1.p1 TRINITY_DN1714_c0_g1~~TRINITY_DN1714_c0_g1_i1.p1  ORF type:complete len:219 (-),score=59.23 TRINITY_DN1714_c0_g1_i1:114-770(-)